MEAKSFILKCAVKVMDSLRKGEITSATTNEQVYKMLVREMGINVFEDWILVVTSEESLIIHDKVYGTDDFSEYYDDKDLASLKEKI